MKKLTPKQAFEHLKAIVPKLEYIEPAEPIPGCGESIVMKFVYDDGSRGIRQLADTAVEWGDCQRWPEEPEGHWRPATLPADAGKKARFRDAADEDWRYGELHGYVHGALYCWTSETDAGYAFCEVLDPAPARPARKARTRASKKARKPGK